MKKVLIVAVIGLLAACASVQNPAGPGGYTYRLQRDDGLHMELPVPDNWTIDHANDSMPMYSVRPPNGGVNLTIFLLPANLDVSQILEQTMDRIRNAALREEGVTVSNINENISGIPTSGIQMTHGNTTAMLFSVKHANGIYLIMLSAEETATQNERDAVNFMLKHLRFVEGQ